MRRHLTARDLGFTVEPGDEAALFKWLLASMLFGHRIAQTIAARTWRVLVDAGIDVRHLRPFKSAAERELGLADHVLGQQALRGPAAGSDGVDDETVTRQVLEDCLELHVALVRRGLDDGT